MVILVLGHLHPPIVWIVPQVNHKDPGQHSPLHIIKQLDDQCIMTTISSPKSEIPDILTLVPSPSSLTSHWDQLIILLEILQMILHPFLVAEQHEATPNQLAIWRNLAQTNLIVLQQLHCFAAQRQSYPFNRDLLHKHGHFTTRLAWHADSSGLSRRGLNAGLNLLSSTAFLNISQVILFHTLFAVKSSIPRSRLQLKSSVIYKDDIFTCHRTANILAS